MLTQYNRVIFLAPNFFAISIDCSISFRLAIPVESIIGLLVNAIFLINNTIPDLVLGVSKQFKSGIKSGFHMTGNEFRIFIESSFIKAEIGKVNNSSVIAIGTVYETPNRFNIEFDINCYNIIKNTTLNKISPADNITASLSLSIT